jgi:hypothetical protein
MMKGLGGFMPARPGKRNYSICYTPGKRERVALQSKILINKPVEGVEAIRENSPSPARTR